MSRRKTTELEVDTGTNKYWIVLCFLIVVGCILNIAAMVLPKWRTSVSIGYNYNYKGSLLAHQVGKTSYGLYKISFDDGSKVIQWSSRVTESKEKADIALQYGQSNQVNDQLKYFASFCPNSCRDALTARAKTYSGVQSISLALLAVMALSIGLNITGIALFFLFNLGYLVIMILWFVSGASVISLAAYWLWDTQDAFSIITKSQIFPFPYLDYCFYLSIISGSIFAFCGLMAGVIGYWENRIRDNMAKQLLEEQLGDDDLNMGYAMPSTMIPHGMVPNSVSNNMMQMPMNQSMLGGSMMMNMPPGMAPNNSISRGMMPGSMMQPGMMPVGMPMHHNNMNMPVPNQQQGLMGMMPQQGMPPIKSNRRLRF